MEPLAQKIQQINALLPQTQCTRCGYPDCEAYARAIATEDAAINRCPPGGAEGVERLAALTGRSVIALDAECGSEAPLQTVRIDEDWCIGCTLCLAVCPTDAIVGGNKFLHTVNNAVCTGCGLCISACPIDCIEWIAAEPDAPTGWAAWSPVQAQQARDRYAVHKVRWEGKSRTALAAEPALTVTSPVPAPLSEGKKTPQSAADDKKARMAAILARAKQQQKP